MTEFSLLWSKICIKYRKQGRYCFSSTMGCRCLAYFDHKNTTFLSQNWPFSHFYFYQQCAETLIIVLHMFTKVLFWAENQANHQIFLPKQLKTHIVFPMLSIAILGTNLWLWWHCTIVSIVAFKRQKVISAKAKEEQKLFLDHLC